MIKAIIFDFGRVIYKTDWEYLNKEFEEKFNVSIRLTDKSDEELLRIYRESDIGKEDFKLFFHRPGLSNTNEALVYYKKLYFKHKILNKELIQIIKKLKKNYLLFGFTDIKKHHYESNLEGGLYKDFKKVFTSFELGMLKADGLAFDILRKELANYNLKPEDCLFIDDHLPNIENARQRGFKIIHYIDFPNIQHFTSELKSILELSNI
ncbi:MAG: HAD-IA family hydrolase [Candidatus Woesearchaeota archaeon]|nr:HAD-IA family hydrolase [Candidatus Woesearchaeota archaeon]